MPAFANDAQSLAKEEIKEPLKSWPHVDEDVRVFLNSERLARATAEREALPARLLFPPMSDHKSSTLGESNSRKKESTSPPMSTGYPRIVEDRDLTWPPVRPPSLLPSGENPAVQKTSKDGRDRPFPCLHCSKAFFRKHDLERHARVHSGDRPYVCRVCQKGFPRSDALRRHIRIERESHQVYFPSKDSDVLINIDRDPPTDNS